MIKPSQIFFTEHCDYYHALICFNSHRHRRTEAEEDKELLEEGRHSQTSVIHFESSPACEC